MFTTDTAIEIIINLIGDRMAASNPDYQHHQRGAGPAKTCQKVGGRNGWGGCNNIVLERLRCGS